MTQLSQERAAVIENIRIALVEGNTFAKVELNDPRPTKEEIKRTIVPFDNLRTSPIARMKAGIARIIAERFTEAVNRNTGIVGLENLPPLDNGAIITAMHYNPTDSTPHRILATLAGRGRQLHIVIQESNVFMKGTFGYLMKNCNTHPVSSDLRYMAANLRPALGQILSGGALLLIYPEQEMWFNYKKPRPTRDGAYHWAKQFGVPIIPTFTEMRTLRGERDRDGLYPVRHTLHVLDPIFPDPALGTAEDRARMQAADEAAKAAAYERIYGIPLTADFIPERDIAGIEPD